MSISTAIDNKLHVRRGAPAAVDVEYSKEISGYLSWWGSIADKNRTRHPKKKIVSAASCIRRYFELVPSGYGSASIIVYVDCEPTLAVRASVRQELTEIVAQLLVMRLFPLPSTGKWTLTGPCRDRLLQGYQHSILKQVVVFC